MRVLIKIWPFSSSYTICYITEDVFMLPNEVHYKLIGVKVGECYDIDIKNLTLPRAKRVKYSINALFLQAFVKECLIFDVYRAKVVRNIYQTCKYPHDGTVFLKLILEPPDKEIIDYAWNNRMLYLTWTRVEIENAFSWLSTLGGAYSALGDYFEYCAEEAGKISMRQYKLSKMLGDDGLAARSKLYSSIAHAQKGRLKLARHIVRDIAAFARQTRDERLNRMCQGVWAKLKYLQTVKTPWTRTSDGANNAKSITNRVGRGDGEVEVNNLSVLKVN